MKTILAFCIAVLGFSNANSQSTESTDPNEVYTVVQSQPVFNGKINTYLSDNIKYPEDARRGNVQGTVYVQFIIERDGSVSGVKVLRGVEGGRSLENEAVRVVSAMPVWTPGMQNGHPVRVQYMVPIHFMLADNNTPPVK
jgi:protein TonB